MSNLGFCDECGYKFTNIDIRLHCRYGENTLCYDCANGTLSEENSFCSSLEDSEIEDLYDYLHGPEVVQDPETPPPHLARS